MRSRPTTPKKITESADHLDSNARRSGLGLRMTYEPTYRQVLSGLDIGVPMGIGYAPAGKSSAGSGLGPHHGGDMTLGMNLTYLDVWRASLSVTHYYGPAGLFFDANHQTFLQTLRDRDFIAVGPSHVLIAVPEPLMTLKHHLAIAAWRPWAAAAPTPPRRPRRRRPLP